MRYKNIALFTCLKSSKKTFFIEKWLAKTKSFNGVWICDLTMPVWHSHQLTYDDTDGGSWSFVGSNVPKMNESMDQMIHEMNHILSCGCEIKWSYDPHSYEHNFSNSTVKPEKFRITWFIHHLWPGYFKMEILEPALQGHRLKPHGSLQFFRLLYAIAKIAFIAARIIALPDFILAVQYMSYY